MLLAILKLKFSHQIPSSASLSSWRMTNQPLRPMMPKRKCGFLEISMPCEKRVLDMVYIKVIVSAQLLVGWQMPVRLSSMARITKATGMTSFLSSRYISDFDNQKLI
jgi:hypothetical protein